MIQTVQPLNRGYTITCPLETPPKIPETNKMALPVSASSYAYAHFKHVSGVPVPSDAEGIRGVSLIRLKIIDALIEHLSAGRTGAPDMSKEQLATLVEQFKAHQSIPYTAEKEVSGSLFNTFS